MATKLAKLMALSVISEVTQGTAVAPLASDFIPLTEKPTVQPITEIMQRHNFREALGKLPFSTGWSYSDVSFKMEMLGASAANTVYAPMETLLKACGMVLTSGGTSGQDWLYSLSSTAIANHLGPATACTINYFASGQKHIVQGAVGSFKISGEAGQTPMIEFSMKGLYTAITETAIPTTTFTHNTVIPNMKTATLTVAGAVGGVLYCQKVEIDIANKIEFVPDVSSTNGLAGFRIVDREPKITINPESETLTLYDYWTKYIAGTAVATGGLSCIFGNGARNFYTVAAPYIQIANVKRGERGGVETFEVDFQVNASNENDEFTITADNA